MDGNTRMIWRCVVTISMLYHIGITQIIQYSNEVNKIKRKNAGGSWWKKTFRQYIILYIFERRRVKGLGYWKTTCVTPANLYGCFKIRTWHRWKTLFCFCFPVYNIPYSRPLFVHVRVNLHSFVFMLVFAFTCWFPPRWTPTTRWVTTRWYLRWKANWPRCSSKEIVSCPRWV